MGCKGTDRGSGGTEGANMKYDVLYLTAPVADIIFDLEGNFPIAGGYTRDARSTRIEPGGGGNTILCLQRLGGRALPVGPLGDDVYGQFLRKQYEKLGIETQYLRTVAGYHTATAACIVAENGVHSFISSYGSCHFMDKAELTSLMDGCRLLCISGYNLTKRTAEFQEASLLLLRRASALHREIFFDPGPLLGEIEGSVLDEVLANCTVLCLNEEEAQKLSGEADAVAAARALIRRTPALVAVKLGAKGCFAIRRGCEGTCYRGFSVKTVDTCGAGDCFLGALMYAYAKGWKRGDALCLANAAGAVKASKLGTGTQVPTVGELCALLRENEYDLPLSGFGESKSERKFD